MNYRLLLTNLGRTWRKHSGVQFATLTVLTATFSVLVCFLFLKSNAERILTTWGKEIQMTVYLQEEVKTEQVSALQKFLDENENLERVQFVTKDQAAAKFQKQMGNYAPQLFSDPNFSNPLPASFEMQLKQGVVSSKAYELLVEISKQISQFAGVDEVSYGQGWVENYASLLTIFSRSSLFLVFVLLAGSLFVIGNSISNAIHQRREEIEILELVGATPLMIRMPYIFDGMFMGGLAASLSVLSCYALFVSQKALLAGNLGTWGLTGQVQFLSWTEILTVLFVGCVFGAIGSYLSVRQLSTGWAAADRVSS